LLYHAAQPDRAHYPIAEASLPPTFIGNMFAVRGMRKPNPLPPETFSLAIADRQHPVISENN
jgi:hypothetical protein